MSPDSLVADDRQQDRVRQVAVASGVPPKDVAQSFGCPFLPCTADLRDPRISIRADHAYGANGAKFDYFPRSNSMFATRLTIRVRRGRVNMPKDLGRK